MSQSVDFFDRQELLNILNGFNPWWTGRASSAPEFRRLAYDACRRYFDNPEIRRAILLSGPRRVGKTTILQQIADALLKEGADPRSLVYLSLDHPLLKLLTISQILRHYHENIYPEGRPATLLLDEVQYSLRYIQRASRRCSVARKFVCFSLSKAFSMSQRLRIAASYKMRSVPIVRNPRSVAASRPLVSSIKRLFEKR